MAFKNAIKILVSKFGLCWVILLYQFIVFVIICGLGASFVIPVIRAMRGAGIWTMVSAAYSGFLEGDSLSVLSANIKDIFTSMQALFLSDKIFSFYTMVFLLALLSIVARFLTGLYELAVFEILDGKMSSDSKLSFMASYISKFGLSCRYVLAKMIYTVIFDTALILILLATSMLFKVRGFAIFAPFLIMIELILLLGIRYTIISMWGPSIISGNKKIFEGFEFSLKRSFKLFTPVFSTFLITWIILIAVNLFFGIFTVGVGLLVTIPVSMLFLNIINITIYYSKNNRRYYVDGEIITPRNVE